ncbi:MAG: LysE family translocator [Deltaproteobacteria bacterium]|nr:LysE family translocator [Deltaproteobacteria bacterium]
MSLETWIAFTVAAMIVLVIPGPTIILVISQAVAHGRRAVLPLAAGVTLGDFTAMTFSLLGLGAVLATSAALFSVLKWIGAGYLIYLGIKLWVSDTETSEIRSAATGTGNDSLFKSAFVVTALNPKSIAFFVAFLPQFVNPKGETMPQLLILGSTFLFLAFLNSALYAFFAGQLREVIRNSRVGRWFNRCGGTALIGAGIFTATIQRSS